MSKNHKQKFKQGRKVKRSFNFFKMWKRLFALNNKVNVLNKFIDQIENERGVSSNLLGRFKKGLLHNNKELQELLCMITLLVCDRLLHSQMLSRPANILDIGIGARRGGANQYQTLHIYIGEDWSEHGHIVLSYESSAVEYCRDVTSCHGKQNICNIPLSQLFSR